MALTSMTNSGGKNIGTTAARSFFEAGQPFFEKPLAPHADHLAAAVEPPGDLVVAQTLGCQEHDLGPKDIAIRQRIFADSGFQDAALPLTQLDRVGTRSGHTSSILVSEPITSA